MRRESASGFQIAFFIFALSIVSIPLSRLVLRLLGPGWEELQVFRFVLFAVAAFLITLFPRLRAAARSFLFRPIPQEKRPEVGVVASAAAFMPFAIVGVFALWNLLQAGPTGPEQLVAKQESREAQLAWTFSRSGAFVFVASVFVAPIIEELVFRGFLLNALARRWGWTISAIVTSGIFAFYHPHFLAAFIGAMVFSAVYRRTGALSSAVFVHAANNLALWYPLLGQFVLPTNHGESLLVTWWMHFAALSVATLALPLYLFLAVRHPFEGRPLNEPQSAFSSE